MKIRQLLLSVWDIGLGGDGVHECAELNWCHVELANALFYAVLLWLAFR